MIAWSITHFIPAATPPPNVRDDRISMALKTIWVISDTHTRHPDLSIPPADAVIHIGDEANRRDPERNLPQAESFFGWFSDLPIARKIFVPGNHSAAVEAGLICRESYPDVTFLIHESTTYGAWRIFGSPYTPRFGEWSYMRKRSDLDEIWKTIPGHTDWLLTHTPPRGVMDLTTNNDGPGLVQVGCTALWRHVHDRIRPRLHAFGHLHDEKHIQNYGRFSKGRTHYLNAAICDRYARPKHQGWLVSLDDDDPTAEVRFENLDERSG